jgi:Uma2 family endonuclease
VVCDPNQIKRHIEGPPTLVVEVQSPQSLRHDRIRKLQLYARSGVKEYWLVTPYPPMVEVLELADDASYHGRVAFTEKDTLVSPSIPDLHLALADVFDFPVPPEDRIEEIRETPPPYPRSTR